jgi:hypothetical protein
MSGLENKINGFVDTCVAWTSESAFKNVDYVEVRKYSTIESVTSLKGNAAKMKITYDKSGLLGSFAARGKNIPVAVVEAAAAVFTALAVLVKVPVFILVTSPFTAVRFFTKGEDINNNYLPSRISVWATAKKVVSLVLGTLSTVMFGIFLSPSKNVKNQLNLGLVEDKSIVTGQRPAPAAEVQKHFVEIDAIVASKSAP